MRRTTHSQANNARTDATDFLLLPTGIAVAVASASAIGSIVRLAPSCGDSRAVEMTPHILHIRYFNPLALPSGNVV